MNRRNFLRSGSLAVAAAAGLPKALKANARQESDISTYRTTLNTSEKNQWIYEIDIDHYGVESFATAKATAKQIKMKVAYVETANYTVPLKQGEYNYLLTAATKNGEDEYADWNLSTKFLKKVSGNHSFDKTFPKNPKLVLDKFASLKILGKDNTTVLEDLDYVDPSASGGGCYLTTACVQHMQLADDCEELQQLRFLRDNYMSRTKAGRELVKKYYSNGPAVVKAINACSNSASIYEYMYHHMILPSVQLVKQGCCREAVAHYKTFVQALQQYR